MKAIIIAGCVVLISVASPVASITEHFTEQG
jgi:hypothetical protein